MADPFGAANGGNPFVGSNPFGTNTSSDPFSGSSGGASAPPASSGEAQQGSLKIQAAQNSGADLSPAELVGIATSASTPQEAHDNAQAIGGFKNIAQLQTSLNKQDPEQQQHIWSDLPQSTRDLLVKNGYKDPSQQGGGGILGAIGHVAKDALDPGGWVGKTMNALGAPLRFQQRLLRTVEEDNGQGNDRGQGLGFLLSGGLSADFQAIQQRLSTPTKFKQSFKDQMNGQSYIDPTVQKQVEKQYGSQIATVAHLEAQGYSQADILSEVGQNQAKTYQQLMQSPKYAQALQAMQNGHLSVGRSIVGERLLQSKAGRDLSGLLDATSDIIDDPMSMIPGLQEEAAASKVVRTADDVYRLADGGRLADRGEEALSGLNRITKSRLLPSNWAGAIANKTNIYGKVASSQFNRALDRMAEIDSPTQLVKEFNMPDQMASEISKLGSRQEVLDHIAGSKELESWLTKNPSHMRASSRVTGGTMPTLSYLKLGKLKAAGWLQKALDPSADLGLNVAAKDLRNPADWNTLAGAERASDHLDVLNPRKAVARQYLGRAAHPITAFKQQVSTAARRLTTIVPTEHSVDLESNNWMSPLADAAKAFLPTSHVNKLVDAMATADTLAQKRSIYQNLMRQMGAAAGFDSHSSYWNDFMHQFEDDGAGPLQGGRAYGPQGMDRVSDPQFAKAMPKAILESQTSTSVNLPEFKKMFLEARKQGVLHGLFGTKVVNNRAVNKFTTMWSHAVITRPALGLRIGAGEGLLGILKMGPTRYAKAMAMGAFAKGLKDISPDALRAVDDGSAWHRWFGGWSEDERARAAVSPDAAATEHYVRKHMRAVAKTVGQRAYRFAPADVRRGVEQLVKNGVLSHDSLYGRDISSVENHYTESHKAHTRTVQVHGGKLVKAEWDAHGNWSDNITSGDDSYHYAWHKQLSELKSSAWAHTAVENSDKGLSRAQSIQDLADKLMDDPKWGDMDRSQMNRKGETVGSGTITKKEAAIDHASVIHDLVDSTLKGENGLMDDDLKKAFLDSKLPTVEQLQDMDDEFKPEFVKGQRGVVLSDVPAEKLSSQMGDKVWGIINSQADFLSRTPLFVDAYLDSRKALGATEDLLKAKGISADKVEDMIHNLAMERSVNAVKPFIHNPELQTQMEGITKPIMPFMFAQRQMFQRWGRTAVRNLDAFHQVAMTNSALLNVGAVHKDEDGNEYFVYPGTGLLQSGVNHVLSKFGVNANLPIASMMQGSLSGLDPDLSLPGELKGGVQNVYGALIGDEEGPLMTLGLDGLKSAASGDTGLQKWIASAQGYDWNQESGGYQSADSTLIPGPIQKLVQMVDPAAGPNGQTEMARAQMDAIAWMEASGHGVTTPATTDLGTVQELPPTGHGGYQTGDYVLLKPTPDSQGVRYVYGADEKWEKNTPEMEQQELDRIKQYAGVSLRLRSALGLFAPSSPTTDIGGAKALNLHNELVEMWNDNGYSAGTAKFLAAHPDATAMTVATTENPADDVAAPGETSKESLQWVRNNQSFVHQNSDVAAFFMPNAAQNATDFSNAAYSQELQTGLKSLRTPQEFMTAVAGAASADNYYAAQDAFDSQEQQLRDEGQTQAVDQLTAQWKVESNQYLDSNPLFAAYKSSTPDNAQRRSTLMMTTIPTALAQGGDQLPTGPAIAGLVTLYNEWKTAGSEISTLKASGYSNVTQEMVDQTYAQQFEAYVKANPDATSLFNSGIRPDLDDVLGSQYGNS